MKIRIPLLAGSLALACSAVLATPYGTVLSSTPVTAQVPVPVSQCVDQPHLVRPPTSGGGAVLGAVVGAAIGNSVGAGAGRAVATGVGAVAGAAFGDHVEAAQLPPQDVTVRSCQTATGYETQVVGYDVVYEYQGQRYQTRMARDPGSRVALNVQVTPVGEAVAAAPAMPPAVIYRAPPVIYGPPPGYGGYYVPYGYPGYGAPVLTVVPRIVIGGGWGYGGHHGHWR
jgi:uncharacterized protein YcfJ